MTDEGILIDASVIVHTVAKAGPPVVYNDGEHLSDSRVDGTYNCMYCGPTSLELGEAFDACCHGEECPWRLAVEYVQRAADDGQG